MNCINRKKLWIDGHGFIDVPCNKCLPCTMNKRHDWSFRLEQEYKYSKSSLFVTLTYDQKHVPANGSLDKKHLQLFMKRLRKRDGTNSIRYYATGEYGTHGGRPHYHIILFNAKEEDVRNSWSDRNGAPVGIVHIGRVTSASVAYVTKYLIQKEDYPEGLEKPFSLMSRAYGIGGRYLTDEMVQWHRDGNKNYTLKDNQKIRLPRFYREKIWPNVNLKPKKNQKITRVKLETWKVLKKKHDLTRKAVSTQAMNLTLENQKKEVEYWKKAHPSRWQDAMEESRNHLLSRVKQKIAFTQTF